MSAPVFMACRRATWSSSGAPEAELVGLEVEALAADHAAGAGSLRERQRPARPARRGRRCVRGSASTRRPASAAHRRPGSRSTRRRPCARWAGRGAGRRCPWRAGRRAPASSSARIRAPPRPAARPPPARRTARRTRAPGTAAAACRRRARMPHGRHQPRRRAPVAASSRSRPNALRQAGRLRQPLAEGHGVVHIWPDLAQPGARACRWRAFF